MRKEYLLSPGPVWIPERVFHAMHAGTMHHRTREFEREFQTALDGVRWLTGTAEVPILLASTGTGAMEASLLNLFAPGDKVIFVNAGVFGERWGKIAARVGLHPIELRAPEIGETVSLSQIEEVLIAHPDAKGFLVQYSETSTTLLQPVAEFHTLVQKRLPECLCIVDAVSAFVAAPTTFADLKADLIIGASQKGFMLPPGLSFLALSARAWKRIESLASAKRSFYFDLLTERSAHLKNTSAWTPALHLILGFNEAVRMIREESLEKLLHAAKRRSLAVRAGLCALGFRLLAEHSPHPGITGGYPPPGIEADNLRTELFASHGIRVAGGQAALEGKIIRVGHMGYVNDLDMIAVLGAFEICMHRLGAKIDLGAATSVALRAFAT